MKIFFTFLISTIIIQASDTTTDESNDRETNTIQNTPQNACRTIRWTDLPEELHQKIFAHLLKNENQEYWKILALVSKQSLTELGRSVLKLGIHGFQIKPEGVKEFLKWYPNLGELGLTHCNIKKRNS